MDSDSRGTLLIIVVSLLLAAFFALVETALSSVSKSKIKSYADNKEPGAERVLYCLDHFDKSIATLLVCTNIVNIITATAATIYVAKNFSMSAVTVSTVITTVLVFFVGDLLPKSIAKKNSEKVSMATAGVLCILMKIFTPVTFVLTKIGNLASDLTKAEPELSVTEEELHDLIDDMEEDGSIDEEQSDLFNSALEFGDTRVKEVLTHRMDMVAVDVDEEPEKIFELITSGTHSRLPIYEKTQDHILGVLQIRKYLKEYLHTKKYPNIRRLIDEVYYAPEDILIDELLRKMSAMKRNMAVISDEFGGTLGIVTVEDILEELVGEIYDESDDQEYQEGGDRK